MKNKNKCSGCGRRFGSAGALATHMAYSKSCGSTPLTTTPRSGKSSMQVVSEKVSLDPVVQILEDLGLDWGIKKLRCGKWVAVPMFGTGMDYHTAATAADRFTSISKLARKRLGAL